MNFGGAMAGMSAAYPGYVQGRTNLAQMDTQEAQAQNAMTQLAALAARGNAFKAMFGADQNAPPMAMAPGVSSTASPGGGQPAGAPQSFMGPSGSPAPAPMPPQAGPGVQQPMAGGAQQPQGPGGAPVNNSWPNGATQPQPTQQLLTWQQIVSKLNESNPGMKPDVLAAAVDQFAPMMSQESKLQWQMLSMQLKQEHQTTLQNDRLQSQEMRSNDRLSQQESLFTRKQDEQNARHQATVQAMSDRIDKLIAARAELTGIKEEGADRRTGVRQEGADRRQGVSQEGMDRRVGVQQEGANYRTDVRDEGQDRRQSVAQEGMNTRQRNSLQSREGEGAANREQRAQLNSNRPPSATDKRIAIDAQRHDELVRTIDGAVDDMRKVYGDGFSATGIFGRGTRFVDFIQSMRGKEGDYAADAFVDKMREIRAMIPRLIAGKGVTGKDERSNLEALSEWAKPGSTQILTYNRLMEMRRLVNALNPRNAMEKLQPGQSTGGTGKASGNALTPELKANVQKALDAGKTLEEINGALKAKGFQPYAAP